jgi:hypothetical protein
MDNTASSAKAESRHRFTSETARAEGAKGGKTTAQRYGREHMAEIGARGFAKKTERHFDGNPKAHLEFVQRRGWQVQDAHGWNGAWKRGKK